MKFFFDNNLSPHLARGIEGFAGIDPRVERVVHLRKMFPAGAKDAEWISELARVGDWTVISCDHFRKSDEERDALRQSGLVVFVLDPQWSQQSFWNCAHNLVRWWPAILDQAESMIGGAAFRIRWRYTHARRFEQIRL